MKHLFVQLTSIILLLRMCDDPVQLIKEGATQKINLTEDVGQAMSFNKYTRKSNFYCRWCITNIYIQHKM